MYTLKEKTKKVENFETIDSGTIEIGPKLLVLSRSYSMSNRNVQGLNPGMTSLKEFVPLRKYCYLGLIFQQA